MAYLPGVTRIMFLLAALAASAPLHAQSDLEEGFAGALRGCETWVLDPASWSQGPGPFVAAVRLGDKMGLVDRVDEVTLPPRELRQADHFWRINATEQSGYVLVVSDRLPMCHITGGGAEDLQPAVEAVIASADFQKRWEADGEARNGEMVSSRYHNLDDPALSIIISRARSPGQRLDRVQLVATAIYEPKR